MDFRQTYHDLVRRDVFPMLPGRLGRVLDFGGGIGATSACLKADGRAEHVTLFDQVADGALPEIDQTEALDFDDHDAIAAALARTGPFDTILALDVLEHLKDPWGAVGLLDKALKPGGSLIVSVPNVNSLYVIGPLLLKGRFDYTDVGPRDRTHLRWFTRSSAVEMVAGRGLRIETVQPYMGRTRNALFNRATLGAFERFIAVQYTLRASKVEHP